MDQLYVRQLAGPGGSSTIRNWLHCGDVDFQSKLSAAGYTTTSCGPNGGPVDQFINPVLIQPPFTQRTPIPRFPRGPIGPIIDLIPPIIDRFFPRRDPSQIPFPTNVPGPIGELPGPRTNGCPPAPARGCCPSGYHVNKTTYWTQIEGVIQAGTKCVKNRRMNPLNPRALARAVTRGDRFVRFAKSVGMKTPEKGLKKRRRRS